MSEPAEPTIRPTREEFARLAREYTVVPVWTEVLADLETPVAAFVKLVGDGPGFLLESVEHGERWSRFSFVGRHPRGSLTLRHGELTASGDIPSGVPLDRGMLVAMEEILRLCSGPVIEGLPPLQGGQFVGRVLRLHRRPDAVGGQQRPGQGHQIRQGREGAGGDH